MKIGLFFGSFNPVHVGHMIIANHMVTHCDLDEVWLVVSPQNPFKKKETLANDHDRLHLVELATHNNYKIRPSSIEFSLPIPSYTVDTLAYLQEKYPQKQFSLIMGEDNILNLNKWKNWQVLVNNHKILVYKRPGYNTPLPDEIPTDNIEWVEAPLLDISASYIRNLIKHKQSIQYLVPDKVYEYLESSNLYH